jgi:dihydrofolate synthase / folylpolyglutamate synthase
LITWTLLGDSLEKIAIEKAGIIKPGIPVVIGEKNKETRRIFENKASETGSPVYFANDFFQVPYSILSGDNRQYFQVLKGKKSVYPELCSDLTGFVQRKNLPVVLEVIELLKLRDWNITDDSVYDGLSGVKECTGLSGRWEIIDRNPKTVVDTGHNVDGIRQVVYQLENTRFKNLHLVYGAVNDKEIDKILQELPKGARYYFTQADIPRAMDVKLLAAKAAFYGLQGTMHPSVSEALAVARKTAQPGDLVLVTGSTYVVGEALG